MPSRFNHVTVYIRSSFQRLNNIPLYVHVIFCFFHLSVGRHLGCFCLLVIVSNAIILIGVKILRNLILICLCIHLEAGWAG